MVLGALLLVFGRCGSSDDGTPANISAVFMETETTTLDAKGYATDPRLVLTGPVGTVYTVTVTEGGSWCWTSRKTQATTKSAQLVAASEVIYLYLDKNETGASRRAAVDVVFDGGHEFTLTIDQADYSVPASMDHAWAELPAYVEVPDYRYVTHYAPLSSTVTARNFTICYDTKKRIALGLKQLSPHPWEALDPNLKVGDVVKGKVVMMYDYGAFIEIAPGVEGLIHVSEMSWNQHLRSAQDFMKIGDEVEAVILTLDREERKMSLGIKQLTSDPWEGIEERYPVGSRHTAKVRNFTNFGIFVEIADGIDGLIHISDLSWTKKIKHPAEITQIGADIDVVVLGIDKENRRLSLGHKQLEENPWNEFESKFPIDSVHEGTITEMTDRGAVVSLGDNIEGFAPSRQLAKEDGTTAKVGETLPFKVTEFSKMTRHITLSHTRTFEDARRAEEKAAKDEKRASADATKANVKKINAAVEKTTLGDITGLAELKARLEEAESDKKAE